MASWAIIQKQNRILFIKRSETTSRPNQWCFPGGGIKGCETPEQACIREVKEETGLSVVVTGLVKSFAENFYFSCILPDENQGITLRLNECTSYQWVDPRDLLGLRPIMDFKIIISLLQTLGFEVPHLPTES